MKRIDKYLQNVRINKAKNFVRENDTILDIGSANGRLFEKWKGYIKSGIGIDPVLPAMVEAGHYILLSGHFPNVWPAGKTFDVITILAVLEHLAPAVQAVLPEKCFDLLNKRGRIIITVPSPRVDYILKVLKRLNLIDGMSLEQHHGFEPQNTLRLFAGNYFKLLYQQRFQFGLNNLFVFEKIG
jgi:2-polyprenyl-3-methyl-5-hydroxy-6-metoxy-1,4-benzoquinol methylase